MRYFVNLDPASSSSGLSSAGGGESPVVVDVRVLPSGALDVQVESSGGRRAVPVDVRSVAGEGASAGGSSRRLSMLVGNRVVDLTVEGTPPDVGVVGAGARAYVRVESERFRTASSVRRKEQAAGGLHRSPMPGRVVKLLVRPGDVVTAGQSLVVVEAMKMENEVRARAAGTVATLHVKEGDNVEANAMLVTCT